MSLEPIKKIFRSNLNPPYLVVGLELGLIDGLELGISDEGIDGLDDEVVVGGKEGALLSSTDALVFSAALVGRIVGLTVGLSVGSFLVTHRAPRPSSIKHMLSLEQQGTMGASSSSSSHSNPGATHVVGWNDGELECLEEGDPECATDGEAECSTDGELECSEEGDPE